MEIPVRDSANPINNPLKSTDLTLSPLSDHTRLCSVLGRSPPILGQSLCSGHHGFFREAMQDLPRPWYLWSFFNCSFSVGSPLFVHYPAVWKSMLEYHPVFFSCAFLSQMSLLLLIWNTCPLVPLVTECVCVFFPTPRNLLWHQLGVLQFDSVLTPSAQKQRVHRLRAVFPQDYLPLIFQTTVSSPGYRSEVQVTSSSGSINLLEQFIEIKETHFPVY